MGGAILAPGALPPATDVEVLRTWRAGENLPALLLSGRRGSNGQRILGPVELAEAAAVAIFEGTHDAKVKPIAVGLLNHEMRRAERLPDRITDGYRIRKGKIELDKAVGTLFRTIRSLQHGVRIRKAKIGIDKQVAVGLFRTIGSLVMIDHRQRGVRRK